MIMVFSGFNESKSASHAIDLMLAYCQASDLTSALYSLNRHAWAVQTGCLILIVLDISSNISLQVMSSISLSQDICLKCLVGLPPSVNVKL